MKSMLLCSLALAGMVGFSSDASAAVVVRAGRVRVAVGRPVVVPPRVAPRPFVYRVPAPRPVVVPVPAPVAVPSAAARAAARALRNQQVHNAIENAVKNAVDQELANVLAGAASANQ